eukprot:gb/GEZN01007070.1/.p1 GENE.gb/GEZN01007070.1/~~gb/GEZN01007070.1/.p1  ORF type:complete len:485 (+),score=34.95 gb/GEZN01007070.1/:41-1495(+)
MFLLALVLSLATSRYADLSSLRPVPHGPKARHSSVMITEFLRSPKAKVYVYPMTEYSKKFGADAMLHPWMQIPNRVSKLEEADIAFVGLSLKGVWSRAYQRERGRGGGELDGKRNASLQVLESVSWWVTEQKPNLSQTLHFTVWNDIPYDLSLLGIDSRIWIMSWESALFYEGEHRPSGCFHRCIMMPYQTMGHHLPSLPLGLEQSLLSNSSYPLGFFSDDSEEWKKWEARPHFLSFCGTVPGVGQRARGRHFIASLANAATNFKHLPGNVTLTAETSAGSLISVCRDMYKTSKFCLHPPGDAQTRGAFFQSVALGCIPVVFEQSLHGYRRMYHGFLDPADFSVALPASMMAQGSTALRVILSVVSLSKLETQRLLQAGATVAPFFMWTDSHQPRHNAYELMAYVLSQLAQPTRSWPTVDDFHPTNVSVGRACFRLPDDTSLLHDFINLASVSHGWVDGITDFNDCDRDLWNGWVGNNRNLLPQ